MDYEELLAKRAEIDALLEQAKDEAKRQAFSSIDAILNKGKITREELIAHYSGKAPSRKKDKVPAKYQSLDGTKQWSGRGVKPKFITEAMAKDKKLKLEDFLIK